MPEDPEGHPPPSDAELSPDHCPNCGRPLKFPENQTEGLCSSCGIFVEVLKPLPGPPSGRPRLTRELILSSPKRDLERLCRAFALSASGHKADLVGRLMDYLQQHPEGTADASGSEEGPAAEPEVMDVPKRREMAHLLLELEDVLAESEGETPAEEREIPPPPPAGERPPPPEVVEAGPERATEAAPEIPSQAEEPVAASERAPPAPPEVPTRTEEVTALAPLATLEAAAEVTKLTTAATEGDAEAREAVGPEPGEPAEAEGTPESGSEATEVVPEIGEAEETGEAAESEGAVEEEAREQEEVPAEAEDQQVIEEVFWSEEAAGAAEPSEAQAATARASTLRRDRTIFYTGSMLTAIGGSGLVLGSFVHDLFRVPFVGHAYEVFGPVNVVASIFGGIMLLAGLAAMGFGLRGGVMPKRAAPGV